MNHYTDSNVLNAESLPLQPLFTPTMLINIATCSVLKVKLLLGQSPRSAAHRRSSQMMASLYLNLSIDSRQEWMEVTGTSSIRLVQHFLSVTQILPLSLSNFF